MEESGGLMLMGEFNHTIDNKNRLISPSKRRSESDGATITRGLDKCLAIYPKNEWDKIVNKLATLPFTKSDARNVNRFIFSGASTIVFDKMGRINLPANLVSYASLVKDCVIIGVGDRLEVWDKTLYDEFVSNNIDNFSDMAENLFGGSNEA